MGALFIAATGFFMAGQVLHGPFVRSAEALELAQPNLTRVDANLWAMVSLSEA